MDIEADPDGLVGEVLVSRYRIEARLGHGAMGTVYRARHIKVGREFAIKVLHPRLLGDDKVRRRFAREAELAGLLDHPNIVNVVDTGDTPDGMSYLVMEYAAGKTLFDLIGESAPMTGPRVVGLVRQLCAGLEHAHERGLIHRDFKPENVIISRGADGEETPRIVDFGVAILRDDAVSSNADRLTTSGLVLGTPHYMAPEHATGAPIDHRIDLFALGVICFEMLTGRPPFDGDGVDVARANLMLDTPVMAVRVPDLEVDPLLEAFTRKLMSKARDHRPATARAARDLIDLIDRDRPAAAAALGVALPDPAGAQLLAATFAPPPSSGHVAKPPGPPPVRSSTEPPRAKAAPPSDNAWSPQAWPRGGDATDEVAQISPRRRGRVVATVLALAGIAAFAIALSRRGPRSPEIGPAAAVQGREPQVAPSPAPATPPTTAATMPIAAAPPPPPAQPAQPAPRSSAVARAPRTVSPPPIGKPAPHPAPQAIAPTAPAIPPPAPAAPQPAPQPAPPAAPEPASATRVAQHYAAVGQRLKTLDRTHGPSATSDLWSPYLRIRINEVMTDPVKREAAEGVLHHLDDQIASRGP